MSPTKGSRVKPTAAAGVMRVNISYYCSVCSGLQLSTAAAAVV